MTPLAWIVRHKADTPETRPVLYWTQADADEHAAQYRPGFATVVALGDVAVVRAQALDDAAADLAQALCDDCENGAQWLNLAASEKFAKDYPHLRAAITALARSRA